jgi:hypothetical protein
VLVPEEEPEKLEAEIVPVVARAPVVALYVSAPSVLGSSEPVAESYMAMNEVASVESVTVTVVASVAKSTVMLFGTSASEMEAQVRLPFAAIVVAKVFAPQSVGLAASADAVEALPVRAPMKVVVVSASVVALYVSPASVAGDREPVAPVPRARNVVVSPAASAKVTVPALPVTDV